MKILKIFSWAMLSIIGLIGAVAGYAYISGRFDVDNININSLEFEDTDFVVVDDFTMTLNYGPVDATNLDVELRFINNVGNEVVTLPNNGKVKANEPFEITLNKVNGNNVGGQVRISASSGLVAASNTLDFWVDVEIPTNGLKVVTDVPDGNLIAGGDDIYGYVFTEPSTALYPQVGSARTFNVYDYKDIDITLAEGYEGNVSDYITVLDQSEAESYGYYNPNYLTNGLSPIIEGDLGVDDNPNIYTQQIKFIKFVITPATSNAMPIQITAKALRTYDMQNDFVDVDDREKYPTLQSAYSAFSEYVQKYSHYIIADDYEATSPDSKKFYYDGELVFNNGQEFLDAVTTTDIDGEQKVSIELNTSTTERDYAAALYYLYVNATTQITINDVEIEGVESLPTLTESLNLHDTLTFGLTSGDGVTNLIDYFGLELETSGVFSEQALASKYKSIAISAWKNQFDAYGEVVVDINGEPLLIPADDEIEIINPTESYNFWTVTIKDQQLDPNDGLRLRFSIYDDNSYYYAESLISIDAGTINSLTLNDAEFSNLTVNSGGVLNPSWTSEVNSFALTEDSYILSHNNSAYTTVKWFVTADSIMTGEGFYKLRLENEFNFNWIDNLMTLNYVNSTNNVSAYEINYNDGINTIIQALNVTSNNDVKIFAAVIKTDHEGNPVTDTSGNYYIVEESDPKSLSITSYIESLNFYTATYDDANTVYTDFVKRNVSQTGNNENVISLLSNKSYEFFVTNLELTVDGSFDTTYEGYNQIIGYNTDNSPIYESSYVNFLANLTYALEKDVYGDQNNRNERIQFIKYSGSNDDDLESVLNIQPGVTDSGNNTYGNATYTYNTDTKMITVTVDVSTRDKHYGTTSGDILPEFIFDLKGEYKSTYRPVTLANSTINLRVKFASVEDDIFILDANGISLDNAITLEASSSQDIIEWKIKDELGNLGDALEITDLVYTLDIEHVDENGSYTSSKIDQSYNTDYYVLSYIMAMQNTELIDIKWSSSNTDYMTITMVDDLPTLNFIKGTDDAPGGVVYLYVDISTYPDANGTYLQTKTKTIAITLEQSDPEFKLYSTKTVEIEQVDTEVAIVNSSSNQSQELMGGSSINILDTVGASGSQSGNAGLQLYTYLANNLIPVEPDTYITKLVDVTLGENASIIGNVLFQIQNLSQEQTSAIYFKDENGEKIYSTYATFNSQSAEYELFIYSESVTVDVSAILIITTPFGTTDNYEFTILSNITIDQDLGQENNIIISDTESVDLSNHYTAQVEDKNGATTLLNLPISFEYDDETSVSESFSSLTDTSLNTYDVGYNNDITATISSNNIQYLSYVDNNGEIEQVVQTVKPITMLNAQQVGNNKNIGIKLYYYVPTIDTDGSYVFVTDTGQRLYKDDATGLVYVTRAYDETGQTYAEVAYSGDLYFLFEKVAYDPEAGLPKVVIKPSVEISTGTQQKSEETLNPINQVSSGADFDYNLVVVDSVVNPQDSSLINITYLNEVELLTPVDNADIDTDNATFNYTDIYNQYIIFEVLPLYATDTDYMISYNMLDPRIENNVLVTNSVNFDLNIVLRASLLEKPLNNGVETTVKSSTYVDVTILYKNSVAFSVTNKDHGGMYYDVDGETVLGHTFSDINKVVGNKIVVEPKDIVLYSSTAVDFEDNYINLLGGGNEDLMPQNLSNIVLLVYQNGEWVEYDDYNPAVSIAGWTTDLITLRLIHAVNEETSFKLQFYADNFDIVGVNAEYEFKLVPSVVINTNYPIEQDYELVGELNSINLHDNYVNIYDRIELTYGYNTYILETDNDLIYMVNVDDELDKIEVRNFEDTSVGINYFTYSLLDANKNMLTSTQEIYGTFPYSVVDYSSGIIEFTDNFTASEKDFYVRVTAFNGAYVDYKFKLNNAITAETISITEDMTTISQSNPLQVYADNDISLYDYINISAGQLSNAFMLYGQELGATKAGVAIDNQTWILEGDTVRFDNVSEPTLVTFKVYTKNFTNYKEPVMFYINVLPNFVATLNENLTVPAGTKINIINTVNDVEFNSSNLRGIIDINGNIDHSNTTYQILTVDGVSYTDSASFYGIDIVNDIGISNNSDSGGLLYFVSNDVNVSHNVVIEISRDFGDGVVYSTQLGFVVKPDIEFNESYNQSTYQELTSAAIGDSNKVFTLADNISIKDLYNNDIAHNAGVVELSYKLVTNATGNTEVIVNPSYIISFNTATGAMTYSRVNVVTNIYIKMMITWYENSDTGASYGATPIEYFKVYSIRLIPNMTTFEINYDEGQSLSVYAGTTVELNFSTPQTGFATQSNDEVAIIARQTKADTTTQSVGIVLYSADTSEYILKYDSDNDKHLITFKYVSSTAYTINIPVYLNLIDYNTSGVIDGSIDTTQYYNTGMTVNFTIVPSVVNVALKSQYSNITQELTPLAVNFQEDRYTYVGQGNGNYTYNESTEVYSEVSENNGDYMLLDANQYDLVELFDITLVSGLTYNNVNKYLIRNSLVYVLELKDSGGSYAISSTNAINNNGIISFMPTNETLYFRIRVSLHTVGNQQTSIYVSLSNGGVLEVVAYNDEPNASDNRYEVVAGTSINVYDKVIYGLKTSSVLLNVGDDFVYVGQDQGDYELNGEYFEYVGEDLGSYDIIVSTITNGEVVDGDYTHIYRETTVNSTTYIRKTTVMNLNKSGIAYSITQGSQYATLSNGVLTLNNVYGESAEDNVRLITVNVILQNLYKNIYITVAPDIVEWQASSSDSGSAYIEADATNGRYEIYAYLNNVDQNDAIVYTFEITNSGYEDWLVYENGYYYIEPDTLSITQEVDIEVNVTAQVTVDSVTYNFTNTLYKTITPIIELATLDSQQLPDSENDIEVDMYTDSSNYILKTNVFDNVELSNQQIVISTTNSNINTYIEYKDSDDGVLSFVDNDGVYSIVITTGQSYNIGSFIIKSNYIVQEIIFDFSVSLSATYQSVEYTYTDSFDIVLQQTIGFENLESSYIVNYSNNGDYDINDSASEITAIGAGLTIGVAVENVTATGQHGNIDAKITATIASGIITLTITDTETYDYISLTLVITLNDGQSDVHSINVPVTLVKQ